MSQVNRRCLIYGILFLGIFLRLFQFATNPPGLFVDEATAGYDAFSLLKTGADRWGFHFPAYFVNWGSGQNVLYSYLSIPFIWVLGLSRLSVRLPSLFLGILTLPLMYVTVKRRLGERTAIMAMALLSILPWHVMLSRWALESNIMPVFLLLGVYTLTCALEPSASNTRIVFVMVPWGLALYAYALSFMILPVMLIFIGWFYRNQLVQRWQAWSVSAGLLALFAFPLVLLVIKNFLVHDVMPIERYLPFGIPLLLFSRFQYVSSPIPGRWINNFFFGLGGFPEGDSRSALDGHAAMFMIILPLALVGLFFWWKEFKKANRPELFFLWLVASIPILVVVDASVVHFNSLYLPLVVASAFGLSELLPRLKSALPRRIALAMASLLVALQATFFFYDYFLVFPGLPAYEIAYAKNYDRAIATGLEMAPPTDPILLQPSLEFSFISVLFYTSYPPEKFQREAKYTLEFSEYYVYSFGRFYIGENTLPDSGPFSYILGKWVSDPCPNPKRLWETRLWKVGRCESE